MLKKMIKLNQKYIISMNKKYYMIFIGGILMKKVLLVTGFLGSGKTTLINNLLPKILQDNKVAIIENEFGEAGIDTPILTKAGVEVKELLSGCICCTLQGEIVAAVRLLLEKKDIDWIIIEPSGISKTSDILKTLKLAGVIEENIRVVNIVDCQNFEEYHDSFGNFFNDQIACAELQLMSQAETLSSVEVQKITENVQLLSSNSVLIFDYLNNSSLWTLIQEIGVLVSQKDFSKENDSSFVRIEAWTSHNPNSKYKSEIIKDIETVIEIHNKRIFRLKGFIPSPDGTILQVQYKPGTLKIAPIDTKENILNIGLVVIGEKLNHNKLNEIFETP